MLKGTLSSQVCTWVWESPSMRIPSWRSSKLQMAMDLCGRFSSTCTVYQAWPFPPPSRIRRPRALSSRSVGFSYDDVWPDWRKTNLAISIFNWFLTVCLQREAETAGPSTEYLKWSVAVCNPPISPTQRAHKKNAGHFQKPLPGAARSRVSSSQQRLPWKRVFHTFLSLSLAMWEWCIMIHLAWGSQIFSLDEANLVPVDVFCPHLTIHDHAEHQLNSPAGKPST